MKKLLVKLLDKLLIFKHLVEELIDNMEKILVELSGKFLNNSADALKSITDGIDEETLNTIISKFFSANFKLSVN